MKSIRDGKKPNIEVKSIRDEVFSFLQNENLGDLVEDKQRASDENRRVITTLLSKIE